MFERFGSQISRKRTLFFGEGAPKAQPGAKRYEREKEAEERNFHRDQDTLKRLLFCGTSEFLHWQKCCYWEEKGLVLIVARLFSEDARQSLDSGAAPFKHIYKYIYVLTLITVYCFFCQDLYSPCPLFWLPISVQRVQQHRYFTWRDIRQEKTLTHLRL